MTSVDMLGRNHVLQRARAKGIEPAIEKFAAPPVFQGGVPVVPVAAIEFLRNRVPIPSRTIEKLVTTARRRGKAAVDELIRQLTEILDEELVRALRRGETIESFSRRLNAILERAGVGTAQPFRLETIFRTNATQAYTAGRIEQLEHPDIAEEFKWLQYNAVLDGATRPTHAAMNGRVFRSDSPVWDEWMPPNGFNSYAPDTIVGGRVESASKAWYLGPMVHVQTRRGTRLSVTVNHPVLTTRGFVPAGVLAKGDHLIVHEPSVEPLVTGARDRLPPAPLPPDRAVDDQNPPARIEDVFEAFAADGVRSSFAGARPLDFHGDGRFMYGQIHVVRPNGLLPHGADAARAQHPTEPMFVSGLGAATAVAHSLRMSAASGFVRLGRAAQLDAPAREPIADGRARGVKALGQLQHRYAAEILIDDVVRIQIVPWSGHVYDLQSPNGWIVANGLVSSNCRCSVTPVARDDIRAEGLSVSRKPPRFQGNTARPDVGFRFNGARALRRNPETGIG